MIVIIINKPMIIDFNKNSNKMREWNGQGTHISNTRTHTHTRSGVHIERTNGQWSFWFCCSVLSESYCIYLSEHHWIKKLTKKSICLNFKCKKNKLCVCVRWTPHTANSNENQIKIYGVKKYFKKILKTDKTNNGDDDQKQCPVSHTNSLTVTVWHIHRRLVDRMAHSHRFVPHANLTEK